MSKESQLSTGSVQIEQKSYEMPPREGMSIAQFLTVSDIERSARYYEKVFGARILTMLHYGAPHFLGHQWLAILRSTTGRSLAR